MIIWHRKTCSTSRYVLSAIQEAGIEPEIIDYIANPPSADTLRAVATKTGLGIAELIRHKEAIFRELNLKNADEDTLLAAIAEHPILIERPIVIDGDRALLGRPKEAIHDWLTG